MSFRFRVQKINRGVMLKIAGITFYPSTDESLELGRLLLAASGGPEALGPEPGREGKGPEIGPKTGPKGGPEEALEAPEGPKARPIASLGPEASGGSLEALKGGPETGPEALGSLESPEARTEPGGSPEASSVILEPRKRPSRASVRATEQQRKEEEERQAAIMAGAPVTNRDRP